MDPEWVDVFPIEHGDIPASYVSLPMSGGYRFYSSQGSWGWKESDEGENPERVNDETWVELSPGCILPHLDNTCKKHLTRKIN